MYTNDKRQRITVRVNVPQFEYIREKSEMMGVSPSEFIRITINGLMFTEKRLSDKMDEKIQEMKGTKGRENDKEHKHDIV